MRVTRISPSAASSSSTAASCSKTRRAAWCRINSPPRSDGASPMPFIDDFRQAWNGLRNAPGFLAVAGAVLALGLGATIFMYGVIATTMITPPPFPHAERLYLVKAVDTSRPDLYDDIHYLDYLDFKKRQR